MLSLLEVTRHCKPSPWHGLTHFHLGVHIDLPYKLRGRVAGPVALGEELLLHAFGVGLRLYLLVASEEASLEMSGSEDQEEGVDTRDDQGGHVD